MEEREQIICRECKRTWNANTERDRGMECPECYMMHEGRSGDDLEKGRGSRDD